jgi:hypothetical protein
VFDDAALSLSSAWWRAADRTEQAGFTVTGGGAEMTS